VITPSEDIVLRALTEILEDEATAAEAPADDTDVPSGTGCNGTLSTGAICIILAAGAMIFARKRNDQ